MEQKYYLTDYIVDGVTYTFTRSRLLGIAHEKYTAQTDRPSHGSGSWYDSIVIERNGQYALDMSNLNGLPDVHVARVVEGHSDGEGWFIEGAAPENPPE